MDKEPRHPHMLSYRHVRTDQSRYRNRHVRVFHSDPPGSDEFHLLQTPNLNSNCTALRVCSKTYARHRRDTLLRLLASSYTVEREQPSPRHRIARCQSLTKLFRRYAILMRHVHAPSSKVRAQDCIKGPADSNTISWSRRSRARL